MSDGFSKILGFAFVAQNEIYWTNMANICNSQKMGQTINVKKKVYYCLPGSDKIYHYIGYICWFIDFNIDESHSTTFMTGGEGLGGLVIIILTITGTCLLNFYFVVLAYWICFFKAKLIHLDVHVVGVIKSVCTICNDDDEEDWFILR